MILCEHVKKNIHISNTHINHYNMRYEIEHNFLYIRNF